MSKKITLKVEGEFPKGDIPDRIKIEPRGTFILYDGENQLALGQFGDPDGDNKKFDD